MTAGLQSNIHRRCIDFLMPLAYFLALMAPERLTGVQFEEQRR